jgi:hypothetical protein
VKSRSGSLEVQPLPASSRPRALVDDVERAARGVSELLDYVCVDHRRLDVRVPQVFLDLSDVHAVQQQMRGKAVPQRILILPINRPPRPFIIDTIPSTANP